MKISSVALFRYRLPLQRTLILRNQPHIFREGLLLRLSSDSGHTGWGEIAPLPGHSKETLADAEAQALSRVYALTDILLPTSIKEMDRLDSLLTQFHPSVRCGIESALLHLDAEARGEAVVFGDSPAAPSVPLNGLLMGDDVAMLTRAEILIHQGYRAVKLKLGQRTLDDDIALTYRVHARIAGKATLRLDANRSWTYEQAIAFGKAVDPVGIEYIEEPLQNASRLAELGKEWQLSIALDETLVETQPHDLQMFEKLKAVVLKPTLLGGFRRSLELATRAKSLGLTIVVSSAFESSVSLTMLARFAAYVAPTTPCGLDTSEWFKENLFIRPLLVTRGQIACDEKKTLPSDLNLKLLTEVVRE